MLTARPMAPLAFSSSTLDLFSRASRDRNPLHLSAEYARGTAFASPVVFGILAVLAGIARTRARVGHVVASVSGHFYHPLAVGLDYGVECDDTDPGKTTIKILEGKKLLQRIVVTFRPGTVANGPGGPNTAVEDQSPAERTLQDFAAGDTFGGTYTPARAELDQLLATYELAERGFGVQHLAALLWCSFLVGMKAPGRRALFAGFACRFRDVPDHATPLVYSAKLVDVDRAESRIDLSAQLHLDSELFAECELSAYVLADLPKPSSLEALPRSDAMRGRVAFVTGASRGLGAALARSLVLHECTVLANYLHSRTAATELAASAEAAPGAIELVQGDITSAAWCEATAGHIADRYGRLDLLVCNAAPALLPLWLNPAGLQRLHEFVASSIAMASTPLAHLLDILAQNRGRAVLVSSSVAGAFDVKAVPSWPHYVAAKTALEALFRVAAAQYRNVQFTIVRPPKLLTALHNTPTGRIDALDPQRVAARIVEHILAAPRSGTVEVLDDFN